MTDPTLTANPIRTRIFGMFLAAMAGFLWGSMSVAAQFLMQSGTFPVNDLVSMRLLGAGLMLLLWEAAVSRRPVVRLFLENWKPLLVYGCGMLVIQWTFFKSIQVSNAATAALMVTFGPLFVTGWTAFSEKRAVTLKEWVCIGLAAAGVVLIVTKGDFDAVDMSFEGAFWGIMSSAAGSFCTIQPRQVMKRVPVGVVVAVGMIVGGGLLTLIDPPAVTAIDWTVETTLLYGYVALFGTVGAFCCYLQSLKYVPAPTTSLLGNFEPLSALVLGILFLGLSFGPAELLGTALIFVMVGILATRK